MVDPPLELRLLRMLAGECAADQGAGGGAQGAVMAAATEIVAENRAESGADAGAEGGGLGRGVRLRCDAARGQSRGGDRSEPLGHSFHHGSLSMRPVVRVGARPSA